MSAAAILPERVEGPNGLVLRRWVVADAEVLAETVAASAEHIRPWMGWMAQEPLTLQERRQMLSRGAREWARGQDVMLGVFVDGRAAGSCGLHRRIARDGLEIGYWIHPGWVRRGLATSAARLLTEAGLAVPDITHVEIHHDKANLASSGVPRKLGFRFVAEVPSARKAPAETGTRCVWRMDRERWSEAGGALGAAVFQSPSLKP